MDKDPPKTIETKVNRAIKKIKYHLSTTEYRTLYPSRSAPDKFYGIAKKHKIPVNGTVDDFPLRPIISNIRTASDNLAKYLAKTLSPLSKSEYTINNKLEFDLILKRIYEDHEVQTNIKKKEMKELLFLCAKNVQFSYNITIYQQCDGVVVGSPLGPVLAGIFMVHLERLLILKLTQHMNPWRRYLDATISIIKETSIAYVLAVLNNFHNNIDFTYEMEENGKIAFLYVLIKNNNTLKTTVYRKTTHNRVYSTDLSHITLIITRAYRTCSIQEYLQAELL